VTQKIDPVARFLADAAVYDIDPDMFVLPECIGGGQHEGGAEQVPLQFQPRVG
jgi:hypothetical protein